jgi:hypothetical protein
MSMIYPKPTTIPRWADTSLNVVEPSSGEKDAGWVVNAIHPSSYENWKSKSLGEWIKWINERWQDGASLDNIKLVAALEVDVAAVAAADQVGIIGRGKGVNGAGGQFYGGAHATSGDGARGVRGYGGTATTSGDGGTGASGLGGNGAGGGEGGIGVTGVGGSPDGVGVKGEGIGTSPGVWGEGAGVIGIAPTNGAGVHGHGFSSGGPGVSGKGGGTTGEGGNFQGAPGTARGAFFQGGSPAVPGDGGVGHYAVGGAGNGASSDGGYGGHGKGGAGGASGAGGYGLVGEAGSPANAGGKAAGVLGLGYLRTSAAGIGSESVAAGVIGVAGNYADPDKGFGVYGWGCDQNRGGVFGEAAGEGVGVFGSSLNGNGGYGVVAQGKAVTPKFGSFRMIGQNADPTETAEDGAMMMTNSSHAEGAGHLKKCHGGAYRHVGVQAWGLISTDGAGNVTLENGIGIGIVSLPSATVIRVTFIIPFSSTNFSAVGTYGGAAGFLRFAQVVGKSTSVVDFGIADITTGAWVDLSITSVNLNIVCCGD